MTIDKTELNLRYDTLAKRRARLEAWWELLSGYSSDEIAQLRIAFMPDENAFDAALLIEFGASPKNIVGISDAFQKDFMERPGKRAHLTKKCGVSFRVFGGKLSEAAVAFEEEGLQFDIAFLDFCGNVKQNSIRNEIEAFMFVMAPTARVAINHLKGREMGIMPAIKKVGREAMVFASVNIRSIDSRRVPDAPKFNREPLAMGEYRNNKSPMAWYVWGRTDTPKKKDARMRSYLSLVADSEKRRERYRKLRRENPEILRTRNALHQTINSERLGKQSTINKRRRRAENPEEYYEKQREQRKQRFEKDPEKVRKIHRDSVARRRSKNPEKMRKKAREYARQWREENRDHIREKHRQWRAAMSPETIQKYRETDRLYRENNREKTRLYTENNREKIAAKQKEAYQRRKNR